MSCDLKKGILHTSFADDLRKETVTDRQRAQEEQRYILSHMEEYAGSFRYACRQAAHSGKRSCTLKLQGNYDDNIHDFYTDDYSTVKAVCAYVESALQQDSFKKLKVSIVRFTSTRGVRRKTLTGRLGKLKYEQIVCYTLQIEAKW